MWDGYKTMWLKMKKEFSRKIIVFILMVLGVLSYGQAGIKQVAILPLVDAKNDVLRGVHRQDVLHFRARLHRSRDMRRQA